MKDIFSDELLDRLDGAIEKSMSARTFGVGQIVAGRYKVERMVGRGNFGYVYRVLDTESGKKRALKTFYEKYTSRANTWEALENLGRELIETKHPNLVRVFEVGADGDLLFFVEEFVSALTLDRLVEAVRKHAAEKGFPQDQMAEVVNQVCAALEETPQQPHLGLSPQNIFMSKAGVKVADLGVVGVMRSALSAQDLAVISNHDFWAPEFSASGTISPNVDVYGLGKLLTYLLTLGSTNVPLTSATIKGRYSARLIELAGEACSADPDLRPPNVSAFVGAFEAARLAPFEEPVAKAMEMAAEDRLAEAAEEALSAVSEAMSTPAAEEALGALDEIAATPLNAVEEKFFGETLSDAEMMHEAPGELPSTEEILPPLPGEKTAADEIEVPAIRAVAPTKKGIPGWAIAAVLLIVGATVFFLFRDKIIPPAEVTPVPVADSDSFELDGIKIIPEPGGPTFQEMIQALLVQAKGYLDTNRLTTPLDDSAFGIYSMILEMDPNNAEAKEGVDAIQKRYMTLGKAFLTQKNYKQADWHFRKVILVNPENNEAKDLLAKLANQYTPEAQTPEVVASNPPPTTGPTPPPATGPNVPPGTILKQITGSHIKSTVSSYMGRVRFCFAKNPDASGEVKIRFVIDPSGKVNSAAVAGSSLGNPEIEQCLVRRVLRMQFPAFEGSAKTVTFPFQIGQ